MKSPLLFIALLLAAQSLLADVTLTNLFSDHMVLQRDQENPVWGRADPGEKIAINFSGQSYETVADEDGKWEIMLAPMAAGGPYQMIVSGNNTIHLQNILIGEVWICAGQSNMGWKVRNSNNEQVEVVSANYPEIRLLNMKRHGTQEPQEDFEGEWVLCSPHTVGEFSAVGYFFGRRIHQALDVPVGLINIAWGGSAAEAWAPRELLEEHERYQGYLDYWDKIVAEHTDEVQAERLAKWREAQQLHAEGKGPRPRWPGDPRYGQHRPANIYNGHVLPLLGYGIRGFIWYQGETNAGRAADYQHLMTMIIEHYRDEWGQGDFPFYWAQLADYQAEPTEPEDTNWPRLREAQTATMELSNTGQAVIIDIGEGRDIHPRNKQQVADRLARWALANDYGYNIAYRSPGFAEMEMVDVTPDADAGEDAYAGKAALITFDHVPNWLYAFDTEEVKGFEIAGEDRQFYWAEAELVGKNQVRVWSESVEEPVAVRYGWAMNPIVNLQDRNGLPVTPFRTDDWPVPAKEGE